MKSHPPDAALSTTAHQPEERENIVQIVQLTLSKLEEANLEEALQELRRSRVAEHVSNAALPRGGAPARGRGRNQL